jgi:hypothetical protein
MSFKEYTAESRREWGRETNHELSHEDVRLGAILRIADAVEKIAKSYDEMRIDRDWWKGRAGSAEEEIRNLKSVIRGLRGALTKARNK